MSHTNLIGFYEDIFTLINEYKWSLFEIESLLPWEFDIYKSLLSNYLEAKALAAKQNQNRR